MVRYLGALRLFRKTDNMERSGAPDKATEIRCAAFALALKKYRLVIARTTDPEVKAYYTAVSEVCARMIVAIWSKETMRMKLLIVKFLTTVSESKLTQPPEFKALHEAMLEARRLIQDRKEGPAKGPKRRR